MIAHLADASNQTKELCPHTEVWSLYTAVGDQSKVRKEGFPKSIRVKKESEFKRIIEKGIKKKSENLIVFRLRCADGEGQKFGIKIARGIKKAVKRNKIKRVIREVLRRNKEKFDKNESVVVLCKRTAGEVDLYRLREELESLIR